MKRKSLSEPATGQPVIARSAAESPRPKSRDRAPGTRLTRIAACEQALYAVTYDSRYDAEFRQFASLHALLDRQLADIGARLIRLGKCTGEVDGGSGGIRPRARDGIAVRRKPGGNERDTIRLLVSTHRGVLSRLREATLVRAGHFEDVITAKLLADLIAGHEEDAFQLRALLWEFNHSWARTDRVADETAGMAD
ncbi:MAG TPA: hypothetical protein VHE61_21835 [Opitutaceae bacterium]|nr:hypothetical protein [Opitutaceae bacterium]